MTGRAIRRTIVLAATIAATVSIFPAALSAAPLPLQPLHADDQFQADTTGHLVVTHGVNAVYKRSPYIPDATELTSDDIDKMARLGITSVRLGLIWAGLEPCKTGSAGCAGYDRNYMARYKAVAKQFNDKGIYVLVDFHQDLYSDAKQVTCLTFLKCDFNGEGAPAWAVNNDNLINLPSLYPLWQIEYFLSPGISAAFDHLHNPANNWNQIQEHYRAAWKYVATQFNGNPGVMGYDLYNEPWLGTLDPQGIQDGLVQKLKPFYQSIIDEIRKVDRAHTIFYEPTNIDAFGKPYVLPADFNPQDPKGNNNLGLSYHVYCLLTGLDFYCEPKAAEVMDGKKAEIKERKIAGLLSEFGSSIDYDTIGYTTDLADTHSASWMYWQWKFWNDPTGFDSEWVSQPDGTLDQDKAAQIARTYPQKIAAADPAGTGDQPSWCFTRHIFNAAASQPTQCANKKQGHFSLKYTADRHDRFGVRSVTTIFVPVDPPLDAQHQPYPNGYKITSISGAHVISPPNAERLQIRNDTSGPVSLELDAR